AAGTEGREDFVWAEARTGGQGQKGDADSSDEAPGDKGKRDRHTLWVMPRLVIYTWPYALFFWAVFLWAFAPEFRIVSRRQEPSTTPQDANSKRLIMLGQGLAMFAAFTIAATVPSAALPHRLLWFWTGLNASIGVS